MLQEVLPGAVDTMKHRTTHTERENARSGRRPAGAERRGEVQPHL